MYDSEVADINIPNKNVMLSFVLGVYVCTTRCAYYKSSRHSTVRSKSFADM